MSDDKSPFEPLSQEQLARHALDLIHRASMVLTHGWEQYRDLWSSGEVLGAALILHDNAELHRCAETTTSALHRWAFDLWGINGGEADSNAGLPRTRDWFESVRAGMYFLSTPQPPVES